MEEEVKGLGDYLSILRRRKAQLFLPMALIFAISGIVAFALPAVYRSEAIILIEQQEIPEDLVRSTVTSYADQRVQVISQRVMSSNNLRSIIEQFDLYADERRTESMAEIIEEMREDITLEMISADVVDPRSGRPTQATIAFSLSYDNESPSLAQKVTNQIVSLFLKENLRTRTESAEETSSFLAMEAEKLSEQISDLERKLADFKERNVGNLPELVTLNLQLMERTERRITDTDQEIRALEERQIYLQSELAQLSPNSTLYSADGSRILGAEDRLKSLEAQYVSMMARYSATHPDRIKMRKEIAALRKEIGFADDTSELELQLKDLTAEMAAMRERYSANHPDVRKLQRSIDSTREALAEASTKENRKDAKVRTPTKPDNPAYIQLQAQLEASKTELRALKAKRNKLQDKLADYEQRLTKGPQVEREYRDLTRDYENALAKYREVKAKEMEAELSKTLEKERKGERFSIVEPPQLPEKPEKPNRIAILFLGFVFSFAGGVGTVAVGESLDHTLHGPKSIITAVQIPPLAVISYINNGEDKRRRIRRRVLWIFGSVMAVGSSLALVHFLYKPLDVLWFIILRRLEVLGVIGGA